MRKRALGWALLLLLANLAGAARAELQITEQSLSFSEVDAGREHLVYAIIEVPEGTASRLKSADVQFTAACPRALGELTLSAASLWDELPVDWEQALDPDRGMVGLFFAAEGENEFHAEIGRILMDWPGPQNAILVLSFECSEVDCECSPLITTGRLALAMVASDGP